MAQTVTDSSPAQLSSTESNTNGIYVSATLEKSYPGQRNYLTVNFHFTPPNTNANSSPFIGWYKGTFYRATNSFCGFVHLKDAEGHEVPLLKPSVNHTNAYPDTYDLWEVRNALIMRIGKGPPLPYLIHGETGHISFSANDYFEIKQPGVYELTIWPKIYKRITAESNLCQRIDFPPITNTFHLD